MSFEYDIPCVATTRSGAEVPISLKIAKSFWDKAIGYMGAKSIGKSTGMVYARGRSLHTLFMRVPIDVCWIGRFDPSDQSWPVVSLDASVAPWRSFSHRGGLWAASRSRPGRSTSRTARSLSGDSIEPN